MAHSESLTRSDIFGKVITFAVAKSAIHVFSKYSTSPLSELADATTIKELVPVLSDLFAPANLRTALLAIHIGASTIHFDDQSKSPHPDRFVRGVATVDNFLHNTPKNPAHRIIQRFVNGAAPITVHTSPDLISAIIPATADIFGSQDHLTTSALLILLGTMGTLHTVNNIVKIAAKIVEFHEGSSAVKRGKGNQVSNLPQQLRITKILVDNGTRVAQQNYVADQNGQRSLAISKIEESASTASIALNRRARAVRDLRVANNLPATPSPEDISSTRHSISKNIEILAKAQKGTAVENLRLVDELSEIPFFIGKQY